MLATLKKRLTAKRLVVTLVYAHDLHAVAAVQHLPSCTIRTLHPGEIELLLQVDNVDLDEVRTRLERGDTCYIALADGRPAHYTWVQTGGRHWVQPAARWTRIRPGEFWIYSCRTADWARGRHIYPNVLLTVLEQHKQRGFARAWISVERENGPSTNGIARAGFQLIRSMRSIWVSRYCLPLL